MAEAQRAWRPLTAKNIVVTIHQFLSTVLAALEKAAYVRRQNLLDKLASELREDLVHLG